MKILLLCDLYDTTAQYRENLLAKYYVKNGHRVTVVASTIGSASEYSLNRYDPSIPRSESWDGDIKVIKLPYSMNLLNRLRRFAGVAKILDQERPDLIFSNNIHLNLAESVAYKRKYPRCRIVVGYSADYSNSARTWLSRNVLHRTVRRTLFTRWKKHIDRIYPVTPISAAFLREIYSVADSEMELLPLGSDSDLVRQTMATEAGATIRQTLGIAPSSTVIFTGGKLEPTKKTHLLMEAFKLVQSPDLHVIVVGDDTRGGVYKRQLIDLCDHDQRVHFVGWVDGASVYRYMAACDLAVFPASQSVLWQQAISMGLPLIVGRGQPWGDQDPSYLNQYDNMIILPLEEIRADVIARHIEALMRDRARLCRMQSMARRVGDEFLNYDRIVENTLRA